MRKILVVLVRHGQSEGNLADYAAEVPPSFWNRTVHSWRLTELGRRQARTAGRLLVAMDLECPRAQWVSPLIRAQETAVELASQHPTWFVVPALSERAWGHEQAGLQPAERAEWLAAASSRLERDPWGWAPPGGENLLAVQARVLTLLAPSLFGEGPDRLLLVTHGEVAAAVRGAFEATGPPAGPGTARLQNGGILAYRRHDDGAWSRWQSRESDFGEVSGGAGRHYDERDQDWTRVCEGVNVDVLRASVAAQEPHLG